jgi:DNA-binding MarR family transcriptional regulator
MAKRNLAEFQALADMRFLIRKYLNATERAASAVGLKPQHYMALLQLSGLPAGQQPTIRTLSQRMQLRHHTVVELVNRMEKGGLFRRETPQRDRRYVLLRVTPRGKRLLDRLVHHRVAELLVTGPDLVRSLTAVIESASSKRRLHKRQPRAREIDTRKKFQPDTSRATANLMERAS